MEILFMTKKKIHKYAVLLEKSVMNAINNLDFELAYGLVDLTYEVCGMEGLKYGLSATRKRIEELESEEEEWVKTNL